MHSELAMPFLFIGGLVAFMFSGLVAGTMARKTEFFQKPSTLTAVRIISWVTLIGFVFVFIQVPASAGLPLSMLIGSWVTSLLVGFMQGVTR